MKQRKTKNVAINKAKNHKHWEDFFNKITILFLLISIFLSVFNLAHADTGLNWIRRESSGRREFRSINVSYDGKNISVTSDDYSVIVSTDGGNTWNEIQGSKYGNVQIPWDYFAASSNGYNLIGLEPGPGDIYLSDSSGSSWVKNSKNGSKWWTGLSISSDASIMAAVTDGYLYLSNDKGENWQQQIPLGYKEWSKLSMTSNGSRLSAVYKDGSAGFYEILGTSVVFPYKELTDKKWYFVTSDKTGKMLAAIEERPGYVYISTDAGKNWEKQETLGKSYWRAVAFSGDSKKIVVAGAGENVFTADIPDGYGVKMDAVKNEIGGTNDVKSLLSNSPEVKKTNKSTLYFSSKLISGSSLNVSDKTKFSKDLYLGIVDSEVKNLQKFLNSKGFIVSDSGDGSVGNETEYFGEKTKKALIDFQNSKSINPTGYFGSISRSLVD